MIERYQETIDRLPLWIQRALAGAAIASYRMLLLVLVTIGSAIATRDRTAVATVLAGLAIYIVAGACGGIFYHLLGFLEDFGKVGFYLRWILSVQFALGIFLAFIAVLWLRFVTIVPRDVFDPVAVLLDPAGIVGWLAIGAAAGLLGARFARS